MTDLIERTWHFDRLKDAPQGVWSDEPDKVQWVDEATDLDCLILRNRGGALCGYVGVPEGHPWFGVDYDSCRVKPETDEDFAYWPEVHGGLTYADFCHEHAGDDAICHVPYDGRPARLWWLGFDTAHSGDISPAYDLKYGGERYGTYKDVEYVKAECRSLARQAATRAVPAEPNADGAA